MDYAYQAKCFRLLLPHRTTFPRRFSLYLVMQVAKKETWTNQNSKLAELYHRWNKASIVKTCFGHLAPQLENNFEISLFQSIFPEQLKIANEKIESGNYRPISHCGFADLVVFTEEVLNGKVHFLSSELVGNTAF